MRSVLAKLAFLLPLLGAYDKDSLDLAKAALIC